MKFNSDIDIDLPNRDLALQHLEYVAASQIRDGKLGHHASGIYVTAIPRDPATGLAALEYQSAEERGYVKLDLLNVNIYQQIRDEEHLLALMAQEPDWASLYDPSFCAQLMHVGNHYETLIKMPEAVDTIARLAMFMAVIRPAKRHLIGRPWAEVAKTIWEKPTDGGYFFKRSHSVAYAHLVAVHMNLLRELSSPV